MPIGKYFGGKGEKVLGSMEKTYGPKKAKQVFYATANKQKQTPEAGEPDADDMPSKVEKVKKLRKPPVKGM